MFDRPCHLSRMALFSAALAVFLAIYPHSDTSVADELDSTIVVLGDSISAAYGLREDAGWVALLQEKLEKNHYQFTIINASITGETSSGGVNRIDTLLNRHNPKIVVLELGGNDGLRGLSLKVMRQNLEQIIQRSRNVGAEVILLGMRIPTNYGARYAESFHRTYLDLAAQFDLPLVPFFLEKVALNPALMQSDGIHPGRTAQPILLDEVWPHIEPLLNK